MPPILSGYKITNLKIIDNSNTWNTSTIQKIKLEHNILPQKHILTAHTIVADQKPVNQTHPTGIIINNNYYWKSNIKTDIKAFTYFNLLTSIKAPVHGTWSNILYK